MDCELPMLSPVKALMCCVLQINPELVEQFESKGLKFVGRSEDGERMEILELQGRSRQVDNIVCCV